MPIDTVMIDALDGVRLHADLSPVDAALGAVVLAHPHPPYDGNRHNPVVDTLLPTCRCGWSVTRSRLSSR